MTTSDTPLRFVAIHGDVFSFEHGEIFGTMYPSRDKLGLDEWVWRLAKTVINRVRDDAGGLLDVKAETVVISEGYASTAADAAYDMRACLHRQIEKAGETRSGGFSHEHPAVDRHPAAREQDGGRAAG
ncbi:hypothetical protein OKW34_000216 [Paraburkholderia youngii]|uniref:hypothetical protein n=1 Tax=Paraburkholderia youngii TaxID=2782701 RepID=UPI003D2313EA